MKLDVELEIVMPRRKRMVGIIRCTTDAMTLNAIAEIGGLIVEPATTPSQFYVMNSGRNLASEVEPALFAAMSEELDQAVRRGTIPPWSIVEAPNAPAL